MAFFGVVAVLLFRFARTVDWSSVVETLKGYRLQTLAPAIALATVSYLLYGSYDLLARRYTGHRISRLRTLAVALISYAFNLNLGALVGGAAFRLRLYSKVGLAQATVLRVIAFSVTTNWLGYLGVAAFAFTLASLPLPDDWRLAGSTLTSIGVVAGLVASLLVALPAVSAATPLVSPARYRRRLLRRSHARTDGRGAFGYRWAVHVGTRPWVCVTAGVARCGAWSAIGRSAHRGRLAVIRNTGKSCSLPSCTGLRMV